MLIYMLIAVLGFMGLIYLTLHHKNFTKRELDSEFYESVSINYTLAIAVNIVMVYFKDSLFVDYLVPNIKNIVFYFLVINSINYWTHRLIHRTPYLRKHLHEQHHDVGNLLPIDFLNESVIEYSLYLFLNNILPLVFLSISIIDYFIVFIIVFAHSIYTHSEVEYEFPIPFFVNSDFHKNHHQIGGGNYSTFFSSWDDYMKTRLEPKIDKEAVNNDKTK